MRVMNEPKDYYSAEEVATLLNLHVRTVRRFIREGKIKAVRVGKQFRIAANDLKTWVGADDTQNATPLPPRSRRVVVSTTVDMDGISPADQARLVNLLNGLFPSLQDEHRRFDLIYYEQERRLRLLLNADLDITNAVLGMLRVVLKEIGID